MRIIKKIIFIFLSLFLITLIIHMNINAQGNIYSNYLSGKKLNTGLVYEPTLVLELNEINDLLDNDTKELVTSVILDVDSDMKIIIGEDRYDFQGFFDTYLKGKYVPIIKINEDNCDSFIDYYKHVYTIYDLMVISEDINLIGKIYKDKVCYIVNSIYDISNQGLEVNRYDNYKYISDANKNGCNIILANPNDVSFKTFSVYAKAMTKVVWSRGETKEDNVNAISLGSYGIVCNDKNNLVDSINYYRKPGWQQAQFVSAHRGITAYCNENSLTSSLAAYSEGATHIEVDLQVLADGNIVLCHNSETNFNSNKSGWYFVNVNLENIKKALLNDYNINYNESYATLEELVNAMMKTDVIMMLELKFDNASIKAVDELKCIENLKRIMDSIEGSYAHFFAITFFAPLAEKMKELMPGVPLGYIGGAQSEKEKTLGLSGWNQGGGHKSMIDYANKIKFLRYYNISLDENHDAKDNDGAYYSDLTAPFYLARGYFQNTWTYEDQKHFNMKTMIATTNKAETCAYLIKEFGQVISVDYNNKKAVVEAYSYNGYKSSVIADIIVVKEDSGKANVLLYYYETNALTSYGLYSNLTEIGIDN